MYQKFTPIKTESIEHVKYWVVITVYRCDKAIDIRYDTCK